MKSFVHRPLIAMMFWLNVSALTSENESDGATTKTIIKLIGILQYGSKRKRALILTMDKRPFLRNFFKQSRIYFKSTQSYCLIKL